MSGMVMLMKVTVKVKMITKATVKVMVKVVMMVTLVMIGKFVYWSQPFGSTVQNILIRKSYIYLFDKVILQYQHTLVSGNPGIVKSVFMMYVLFKLREISKEGTFILGYSSEEMYLFIRGNKVERYQQFDAQVEFDQCNGDVYYLFDCATKGKLVPLSHIALKCKKSVVFSSPDKANHASYAKDVIANSEQRGVTVYLPTWSLNEVCDYLATGYVRAEKADVMHIGLKYLVV